MLSTKLKRPKNLARGVLFAFLCAFGSIVLSLVLGIIKFYSAEANQTFFSVLAWWFEETSVFVIALAVFLLTNLHDLKHIFLPFKIQARGLLLVHCFFAVFSGLFYNLTIIFAGGGYGNAFSGLYPIFVAIFARILFREILTHWGYIGLGLGCSSTVLFSLLSIFLNNDQESGNLQLGVVFGVITALFWALEAVYCDHYLQKCEQQVKPLLIMIYRGAAASITSAVSLPIFAAVESVNLGDQFAASWNSTTLWLWLCLAIAMLVQRLSFIVSIRNIGSTIMTIIDSVYIILGPIVFSILYQFAFFSENQIILASEVLQWWGYILVVVLFISIIIIVLFGHPNTANKKDFDHKKGS